MDFIAILYLSVIALSAITGIVCAFSYGAAPVYKTLALFMAVTAVHAFVSNYYAIHSMRNHHLQNAYNYLRFPLLQLVYFLVFKSFKSWLRYFPFLFWAIALVCVVFFSINPGFNTFHTTYYLLGASFTTFAILAYFFLLFSSEKVLNPFSFPLFWTSVGMLFFFLTTMPSLGLINLIIKTDLIAARQISIIPKVMSLFLYSLLAVDFVIHMLALRKKIDQTQFA